MNKIKVIILLILISSNYVVALENKKTFFANGDKVQVDSCDQWSWCKLSDKTGYIKEFFFTKDEQNPHTLIQSYKGVTYLYQLVGVDQNDLTIEDFIRVNKVDYLIDNARANYMYGYIKDIDLEKYMQKYIIQEEQEAKILIKKEEKKKVEELVETTAIVPRTVEIEKEIKVEKQQNYFTYFDMGVAKFSSNHPDSIDMMLDIGLGYNLDNQNNITFGYMGNIENSQDQLRGVELNNIYLGYNYNFLGEYNPSLGVIAGYSTMKVYLDKNSAESIDEEKNKKMFYGIQSAVNKKITSNLSWEIKLSYLQLDLKTPSVNVTNSLNLFGGIIYKFD